MTIEEKAQRYDKAINVIKELKENHPTSHVIKDWIKENFPELRESEDERIRKWIIGVLSTYEHDRDLRNAALAWLEKQSTPQVRTGLEWLNTIDDACDKRYAEEYAHGEYCHEQSFKWGFQEGVDWLEKQGRDKEMNNFDVLPGLYKCVHRMFDGTPDGKLLFEVGNIYKCLSKHDRAEFEVSYGHSVYLEDPVVCKHFIPYEKQSEQKSSDEVEPKFKVGDWVVQENIGVYKVIEVCESWYEVVDNKDKHYSIGFDKEYVCHLYTIKDAKDGDVLVTPNYLYIFNSIDKETETVSFYCLMKKSDEHFSFGDYKIHDEILNSTPATKEQRDLLFAKMKEAGYKWGTESKELKEIKQKSAEWSEEDEDIRDTIIRDLKRLGGDIVNVKPAYKEEVDWLKSLKRRIGWKPSEEQMKALHDLNLTGNISYAGQGQVLIELYNDLYKISNVKDK